MLYDPRNWYWTVAGDASRAYSSAGGAYVPANDAALIAWRKAGGVPTRIASEAEMVDVLVAAGVVNGLAKPLRTCSVFEFMYGRCTAAERIAIRGSADPHVVDFAEALKVIPQVELDSPLTIAGLAYMESVKLLAAGRAAEIRA